jgi:hypothetical protein
MAPQRLHGGWFWSRRAPVTDVHHRMTNPTGDDASLRTLLSRRARDLIDRVGAGEEPTKEEVDALDRLTKLMNIQESLLRARQRRRAGLALLGMAAVVATAVMTVRVWWDNDIAVDATVSAVTFVPAEPAYLIGGGVAIERLELRDVDSVVASQLHNGRDTTLVPNGSLVLTPHDSPGSRNFLTLAAVVASESGLVRLQVSDTGLVRADFRSDSGSFYASAASTIEARSAEGSALLEFDRTGQLHIFHGRDPIAVTWRAAGGRYELPNPVPVTRLDLFAVDPRTGEAVSTLRRGAVYRESLGRDSIRLRRDETLSLDQPSGLLRSVVVQGQDMTLFFRGRAANISTATAGNVMTLRPTLLDWARAQSGVWWLWTTILPISAVFLSVRRWWREPR